MADPSRSGWRDLLKMRRSVLALLLVASLGGCFSASQPPAWSELMLHLDYRSGGEAGYGQLLTFFPDRHVRLYSTNWKERWSVLSPEEWALLEVALSDARTDLTKLNEEGYPFACCDNEEIGVYLSIDSEAMGLRIDPPEDTPPTVRELLMVINDLGQAHFSKRYMVLTIPASPQGSPSVR